MSDEEVRKAICYITGDIKLEFDTPNGFEVTPLVQVDGSPANIRLTKEDNPRIWKYLAVVEKGNHVVLVQIGNVKADRTIIARGGQVTTLNFVFSSAA